MVSLTWETILSPWDLVFYNPTTKIMAGILTILIFYFTFIWESRMVKMLNKFPGPRPLPLLGNAVMLMNPEKVVPMINYWSTKWGDRVRGYLGIYGAFIPFNPSDVEKILTSSTVIDKSIIYKLIQPWLGNGLLLSTGKKWHTRRKALTPAFHFKILDNFLPIMNEQSKILVDLLTKRADGQNVIEVTSVITRCALDIICETAMGMKLNSQSDLENAYAVATLKESDYFWYRATHPWYLSDFTWSLSITGRQENVNRKVLHDFTDKVIRERKELILGEDGPDKMDEETDDENIYFSSKRKFAFLDLLIREQAKGDILELTDQDIRDEVDTFMFEGHDTTSAAISWTIFLLGLHPEHQATVQAELDSVFGDDRQRAMTTEDLTKLKFLECCIKESLRLYPSVPVFGRQLFQDFELDDGKVVPRDVTILIVPYIIHRTKEIFPDPEEFRPSRFFPENCIGRHPYAYIPFSAGPRNCIGQRFAHMEEKVILGNLFRSFKVQSLDTRESVTPLLELITRPKNGIRVKLTRR